MSLSELKLEDLIKNGDLTGMYFREAGQVPLLTQEEEVSLAQRIEKAKNARDCLDSNFNLSRTERQELEEAISDGKEARDHLAQANTRLVISIAKRYIYKGLPFDDLIQEGNIGLLQAIDKFNYHLGFRFSTYATWWIRQKVTRAMSQQRRTIRLPNYVEDRLRLIKKVTTPLTQKLSREPTPDEIADAIQEIDPDTRITSELVSRTIRDARPLVEINRPKGDSDEDELGDFMFDTTATSVEDEARKVILREKLENILNRLPEREEKILRLRMGFDGDRPYALEEIAQKFDPPLSRERIRQLQNAGLGRMRRYGIRIGLYEEVD
jgi:RNA polymerase primary sigma factor